MESFEQWSDAGGHMKMCIRDSLLMDEATSALDPISTAHIEELAVKLKEEYTVIMVTHNMQQAQRIACLLYTSRCV